MASQGGNPSIRWPASNPDGGSGGRLPPPPETGSDSLSPSNAFPPRETDPPSLHPTPALAARPLPPAVLHDDSADRGQERPYIAALKPMDEVVFVGKDVLAISSSVLNHNDGVNVLGMSTSARLHDGSAPKSDGRMTPQKSTLPFCGTLCTPEVANLRNQPAIGMEFPDLSSVVKFYKDYAHDAGFGVRFGQQKKVDDEVVWKRFYCSREGFRVDRDNTLKENQQLGKKKRKYDQKLSRCGCEAMICVVRTKESRYRIDQFQPMHTHELSSPGKKHLIRSNRQVSEKVKATLFDCHKSSIGTSLTYRYLRVSDGGFQNVLEPELNSSMDMEIKKVASELRNGLEGIIQQAEHSKEAIEMVKMKFEKFMKEVNEEHPASQRSRVEEMEGFIGSQLPTHVEIMPPSDVHTKGRAKRIKGHMDKGGNKQRARRCKLCKELGHDMRNCSKRNT